MKIIVKKMVGVALAVCAQKAVHKEKSQFVV